MYVKNTFSKRTSDASKSTKSTSDAWEARASRGAGAGLDQLTGPAGLAVHPDGSLFVADAGNHRVLRFAGKGCGMGGQAMGLGAAMGTVRAQMHRRTL